MNLWGPPQAPLARLADLGSLTGGWGSESRGISSEWGHPRVMAGEQNLCLNATQSPLPPGNQPGGQQFWRGGEAGEGASLVSRVSVCPWAP